MYFLILLIYCSGPNLNLPKQKVPEVMDSDLRPSFNSRIPFHIKKPHANIGIMAVGDLMMSSWVIDVVKKNGCDYPFDSTRSVIKKADFAIANLEAPLTAKGDRFENKKFTFKTPPGFVKGIKNAGFDVVTLANNHILDYGCEGLLNTIKHLNHNGIAYCGSGGNKEKACRAVILEKMGLKVAFLGFSFTYPKDFWAGYDRCGTCHPSEEYFRELFHKYESQADFVIASFHWGQEKRTTPKEYQIYFAHLAIDLGADLVLGHHPHVLQGLEIYKNRLIAYSLGNYVFGSYSNTSKTSMLLYTALDHSGLIYARVYPISVYNAAVNFQPRELDFLSKSDEIKRINMISRHLNNDQNIIDNDGFVLPNKRLAKLTLHHNEN
jgi:poly-gamma-glutamate synthesis protein (capsule biosynthesis protein)